MTQLILQPIGFSPKGFRKPTRWDWLFHLHQRTAEYYRLELGKTFQVASPRGYTGSLTWAEIQARYPITIWNGGNIVRDAVMETQLKGQSYCRQPYIYAFAYFHPPMTPNPQEFDWQGIHYSIQHEGNPVGMGGAVGCENWGCTQSGPVPGGPGTNIGGDVMLWLACGYSASKLISMGWPASAWPLKDPHIYDKIIMANAHEIGHSLGLGHPDQPDGSPMKMWMWEDPATPYWDLHFTDDEKATLLATGLLS